MGSQINVSSLIENVGCVVNKNVEKQRREKILFASFFRLIEPKTGFLLVA